VRGFLGFFCISSHNAYNNHCRQGQAAKHIHTHEYIAGLGWAGLGWLLHCKSKTQREHLMLTTPLFLRLERAWHLSNMRAVNKHTHTRERERE
jgi:hypothetical protein